jgi:hypothetical protein
MAHSKIVGGSTAKRVIACPGSVALVQKVPPKPATEYSVRGSLLHKVIALILEHGNPPSDFLGATHTEDGISATLDQELLDEKILPALAALNEIDPDNCMEYVVEAEVSFGDLLPGVFGSADLIGRIGNRAVVLDWKFGDGVAVDAEENEQGLFYTAAAMRTERLEWVFDGATEIEIVIVQPPVVRRWVTTLHRVAQFENDLVRAVRDSQSIAAPMKAGDHCRWCAAKPICPLMTGVVDRALQKQIKELDVQQLSDALSRASLLEEWVSDLRGLALQVLESGNPVPGYKLVQKRAARKWTDEEAAATALKAAGIDPYEAPSVLSVAQAEKKLKTVKKPLPSELMTSQSSGTTMAPESDPRPAVLQIGQQLSAALSKIV